MNPGLGGTVRSACALENATRAVRHGGTLLGAVLPTRREALLATAAGALLAASGRPSGPWWAAVAAGALLWPLLARAPAQRAAGVAAIALAPVPAVGYEGLRVYDPGAWWVVTVGVAVGYGTVGGLAAAVWARWRPAAGWAWRPFPWLLAWAGIDLLLSHARPWPLPVPVTPGYALVGGPLVAIAAWAGPTGLGAAWGVLGIAAAALGRGRFGLPGARAWWPWAAAVVALAAATHLVSARDTREDAVTVAVVQRQAAEGEQLATYLAAARGAGTVDLHVWPEAALGRTLASDPTPLQSAAVDLGAPVLAGAFRRDEAGGWRNAAVLADGNAVRFVADKRWTVPGYEAWLTPGVGERWPAWAAGWRWGVLLCWESLFLDEAIARVRSGADALAVLAHDGWAAGTVTPWWHARAGRLLAWSVGRPVVVASHDGPSMAWSHVGRSIATAPEGDAVLVFEVPRAPRAVTPYVAYGPRGLAAAWAVAAAVALSATARRRQGCGAAGPQAT